MHFDAITYSLLKDRKLRNVAPLCTVEILGWTGSQSGEVLFTGDGTTVDFSGKVSLPPINPLNSFTLHYTIGGTSYSITADENGNLSDANMTGTINQDGTYEFHFNTAPDNGTDGTADYDYGISPANLENTLDPSNPNPSDWGWTSSAGSSSIGSVLITPPMRGIFLVSQKIEYYTVSGSGRIQITGYLVDYSGSWHDLKLLMSYSYKSSPYIRTLPCCCIKKDDFFEKLRLFLWVDSAGEYKIRWWNIEVFLLQNI